MPVPPEPIPQTTMPVQGDGPRAEEELEAERLADDIETQAALAAEAPDEEPQTEDAAAAEPAGALTPKRMVIMGVVTLAALGGLYFLLPKLAGLHQTWGQLKRGDPLYLALGAALEVVSIGGYAILFRTIFGRGMPRLDWRASLEIPLAGIAAIRLLAAAGAGGVAVTVWALRRAGMPPRTIACRMVANYIVQYSVYLGAIIVCGLGLRIGLFAGEAPWVLTVVPALLSLGVVILVASMGLVPQDFEERLKRLAGQSGRISRLAARFASAPATVGSGVRTVIKLLREKRVGLLGALVYWGFDIAVLGVSLKAFGTALPVAVLVLCYFLGTLGSLLPLPGGVGGVEGGMIGALVAFGVPGSGALIGVLAYRAISFWLPTLPGVVGYVSLRSTVRGWQSTETTRATA
jgi:putative heme transporter